MVIKYTNLVKYYQSKRYYSVLRGCTLGTNVLHVENRTIPE